MSDVRRSVFPPASGRQRPAGRTPRATGRVAQQRRRPSVAFVGCDQAPELDRRAAQVVALGEEKPVVLRTYRKKRVWEVGRRFGDATADSSDEEPLTAGHKHPGFRITVKS